MGALRYLLDTCVFLWLCAKPSRLSARARAALSDNAVEILLSDVSVLEIAMKWGARKIVLPAPPRSWIEEQARTWQTVALPLSRQVIYRATELPGFHRDPFDRLLVASALEETATIVTPDESIHRYPVSWVW